MKISTTAPRLLFCLGWFLLLSQATWAIPTKLGDLDDDNVFTANDLAKLVAHSAGTVLLPETLIPFADINQDGAVNNADQAELVKLILESATPQDLPLAKVRKTSPFSNEGDVAVTRETVVTFSMPLSLSSSLDTSQFYADSGGRRILSRVEISSDRRKATLFFLEPLPSSSRVRVVMEPTTLQDILGRSMDLDGDGTEGGNLIFSFNTLSITGQPGTAITGRVLASERGPGGEDIPIVGATIMVDGAEETLRTTTDAQGNFILTPCPAGSFFVHVDGRTSGASNYPHGDYYPSVGKRWDAVAGRMDNLSGNIQDTARGFVYLPIIKGGSLVAVSATEETPVDFPEEVVDEHPELEGTRLTIPPNSLFADDGTRGGEVGIAPVDPDRLPSPLPPGVEVPLVITIQTDGGTNFDVPVPAVFPNLPDPSTGEKLPPGAKSALFSFNHDLGDWEVVGAMTVTEDGEFVTTDAGVGIRQPGWHFPAPGSGGNGEPPISRPKPKPEDPPCPEKSAWDYATLIYDVGKETASCAIEFAKAKEALKCILALVDLTKNLLAGSANIGDALGRGENMEAIEHLLGIIEADLADTEALIGCAEAASPFSRAQAAFECVGNALNIADGLCQFNDDPSAPEKCRAGTGARKFCQGIQLARYLHTDIKTFVDFVKGFGEHAVLAGATFAVKQTKLLLESIRRKRAELAGGSGAPPPPPGSIILTPEEAAQVRAQLAELQKSLLKLQEFANGGKKLIESVDKYQRQADAMVSQVAQDLSAYGESVQRSSYYRITINDVVQRGRTTNSGTLSLIMAPDARYDLSLYDPVGKEIGSTLGATGPNGSNIDLNAIAFQSTTGMLDDDNDGLPNQAESIIGTNPLDNDTDNDGLLDGAEVEQGSDPLGGLIAQTGILTTVPQTLPAWHITAANNLAVISHRTAGISVYNIADTLAPSQLQLYDTPGTAEAAVIARNLIAVADTNALLILDASNPGALTLKYSVAKLSTDFVSIATDGVMAYTGSSTGKILAIDLASGSILGEINLSNNAFIQDLTVWRGRLYALQLNRLSTINLDTLEVTGSLTLSGQIGAGGRRLRLFAGDGTLYATHTQGFNIVDTATTPDTPTLVTNFGTPQFGWKQIVTNGNGLGVVAASPNSTDDGPHHIDLFTLGADERTPTYNATFVTPGLAAAVSLFNGLAYVADSGTGLQVLNFKAFDTLGVPPTITLSANITLDQGAFTGQIESGKPVRAYATTADDVQVRNVEFYVDGTLSQVDGNYPFEGGFNAPVRTSSKTSFTLRAKVSDTGGNTTWSPTYTITLLPDIIPPVVKRTYPSSIGGQVRSVLGVFNEALDPATVTASSVKLTFAGPDGILDGGDDTVVTAQSIVYREDINAVSFNVADILPQGLYRGTLTTAIKDASGNALASEYNWNFSIDNSSNVWMSSNDGTYNWNDAANWSTGTVPEPDSTVIIDAGPGVLINVSNTTLTGITLSVQGGAKLALRGNITLNNVIINGDVYAEGYAYVTILGTLTFDNGRLISNTQYDYVYLVANEHITLTGTGEIVTEGYYSTQFYGFSGMTAEAGITIRSRSWLTLGYSYSTAPFINKGTLLVDGPDAQIYINNFDNQGTISLTKGTISPGIDYVNNGTMELSGTGELIIYDNITYANFNKLGTINRNGGTISLYGNFDLQGGTFALNATTGSWKLRYGTIMNGTITTSGGATFDVYPGGYSGTLENVDLQGTVNVPPGSYLNLDGTWQNHGTINLDNATLYMDGTFRIADMGTIIRSNNSQVRIVGVINNTGLTFDPGNLPTSFLIANGTVKGGNVGASGPGPVIMPDNAQWKFDGVTLTSDLKAGYSCSLGVTNGLTLNNVSIIGQSLTEPNYAYLYIYFQGTQTVSGTGSFIFDDTNIPNSSLYIQVNRVYDYDLNLYPPAHVTFGSGITTRVKNGQIYCYGEETQFTNQGTMEFAVTGGFMSIYGQFHNTGTINVSKGTLTLENEVAYSGQPWTNTGVINLSSTGVLRMGGIFTLAELGVVNRTGGQQIISGILNLAPADTLALNASTGTWELGNYGTVKGGSITTADGVSLLIPAGTHGQLDGATLLGTLDVIGGTLNLLGDWVNQGIINGDNATINCGGEFVIADLGVINRTNNTSVYITGILNNTAATFQLDNTTIHLGNTGTIKGGTITCSSDTFTPNSNSYSQTLDGVTIASSFTSRNNLYIRNGITINAGVTIRSEGTYIYALGTQTFGGGGTLLFVDAGYFTNDNIVVSREDPYTTPATLTFGPNLTILAQTNLWISSGYPDSDNIINQGLIRSEVNGAVIDIRRPFQNNGQIQEANGGTVFIHD